MRGILNLRGNFILPCDSAFCKDNHGFHQLSPRPDAAPLPCNPPLPLLLILARPNCPDLLLNPVRAVSPAQGVIVRRDLLQALVLLCQPIKGGVQRAIPLLEPVKDKGTVLLSYRATHKRTGLLPAASLPDWRMGMPAAKAFRIDASHRVPLQRPASCRLSLPDGSEANLPHETVKSLRRQDKRTVPSSPPVSQKLSG